MSFAGKKVLILGGTSGIGLATAKQFQAAEAQVVVVSRDAQKVSQAVATLGGNASGAQVDVLDLPALQDLFAQHAPIDIMVNAATGGERAVGPFETMDLAGFQGSFRKLWGYTNATQAVLPHLTDDGNIVLVSGSPARKAPPGYSAISTVGNAVEGFCRAIATEIGPKRINVVSPGFIDTPMFPVQGEAREEFLVKATANNLIKRAGSADEVASGILFVAGNAFVTGTTVDVDGGALLP